MATLVCKLCARIRIKKMFSYTILGITVNSVLDKRRILANDNYPVKIRVTFNRARHYYNTGISLNIKDWERLTIAKNSQFVQYRKIIQITFDHIANIVELLAKEDLFSFENLHTRLGKGIDSTLNVAYQAKIDRLTKDDKHNTSDICRYSLKAVESFAGKAIKFSSINVEWLKQFEKHLRSRNINYTTISIYIRALQAIINEGKNQGIVKAHQYPFGVGKYVIPQTAKRNISLKIDEIALIVRYKCCSDLEYYYRDLWFFSYLCNGANIADICNLKFENIKRGNIEFYRQKTLAKSKFKKAVVAFITPEMQKIINKWGNKNRSTTGYIFPILNGSESSLEHRAAVKSATRSINHHMGKIGENIGVGNITTYTARHSFATVLKRAGGNIAFISESLGHSDVKVTENYLANFEDEERQRNAFVLTDFSKVA